MGSNLEEIWKGVTYNDCILNIFFYNYFEDKEDGWIDLYT